MDSRIRKQLLQITSAAFLTTAAALGAGNASAQTAPDSALPAAAQQGDVQFLSGGVGQDESKAIKHAAVHWPLSLEFIGGDKNFVSDVAVTIADAKGTNVLETSAQGPYMLVRIKPGHYTVKATYAGHEVTHQVDIAGHGHARARFVFPHQ